MAGLLDGIDPQTALLLGLGSGLLGTSGQGRRASFGEALANGMQAGTQGYRQAIGDRQRAEQMRMEQAAREQQMMLAREQMRIAQQDAAQRGEMFGLQKQEHQLKIDDRSAGQRRAAMKADYMNRVAAGELQMNPQQAFNAGLTLDEIKALTESKDWGRAQVHETRQIRLPDGRVVDQPYDKFGQPVGDPRTPFIKPEFVNQGDKMTAVDPTQLQAGSSLPINMSQAQRAANDIARGQLGVSQAGLGLSRQRLDLERQQAGGLTYIPDVGWAPKTIRPGEQPTVVPLPGGGVGKPPNDSQGKALLFGSRMKQADQQIARLEAGGTKSGNRVQQGLESIPGIGRALGMAANPLVSDNQQSYAQARRNFINAALRRESGAVISPSEEANADLQYFPQPGDGPRVLEQKRQNRKLAMDAVLYEAGPHAAQADKMIPPASQNFVGGQSASGQIKPAQAGVIRFDANGNMIGN